MNHLKKTLSFDLGEREYSFICSEADKRNITVEKYIIMCVLAYSSPLYLSSLANQLRRLRYQLKSMSIIAGGESNEKLIELQKSAYRNIIDALQALHHQ